MSENESVASSSPSKALSVNWKFRAFIFIGLAVTFGLSFWMGANSLRMTAANEGLVVAENDLDFGEVWEDGEYPWHFIVENPTPKDITIVAFSASCNCLSIEPHSLQIPAGQKAEVHVKMNLRSGAVDMEDETSKKVTISLMPHFGNGYAKQVAWNLHGRVRRLLKITPRLMDFGTDLVHGNSYPTKIATATTTLPVQTLHAKCIPDMGRVEVNKSKACTDTFEIKITPHKSLPAGPFTFRVAIEPVSSFMSLPTISFPVEGVILPEVQALPQFLCIGARPLGQTVTDTVILRSLCKEQAEVENIWISDDDLIVEPILDVRTRDMAFCFKQRISKRGEQSRIVAFSFRKRDHMVSVTRVNVTYVGLSEK